MMRNVVEEAIEDRRRAAKRTGRNLSFSLDFFAFSSAYDYRLLRIAFNFPLGVGIGYLIWLLSFSKLKVVDWNESSAEVLKWTLVVSMGLIFAISPVFRSVSLIAALNALSRQGQTILTVFVLAMVMEGPMQHIVGNFERTADSTLCHMHMETELAVERVRLLTGPIEDHLKNGFGGSTELGRKVLEAVKGIVDPFGAELVRTDEDERMEEQDEKGKALLERLKALRGEVPTTTTTEEPAWKKLKTKSAQLFAKRMQFRCNDIFNHAAGLCFDSLADMKDLCYKKVIFPIDQMFCGDFDVLNLCQIISKRTSSVSVCSSPEETDPAITTDFDDKMQNVENISHALNDELLLNLHFVTIEKPRLLRVRLLRDIKLRLTAQTDWLKLIVGLALSSLNAMMTIFVYSLFSDAYNFVNSYLTDIDFFNRFTTDYFWRIDERRKSRMVASLAPLTKFEAKKFRLKKPFSGPTNEDVKESLLPLVKWLAVSLVVCGVVFLDLYYYGLLNTVEGDGILANLTRKIIGFNFTRVLSSEMTNEHCLVVPLAPDWTFTTINIFLPLCGMLLLQVIFSFMIGRVKLGVTGFIFRKRAKARILHLYNKMLRERSEYQRVARARIRYQVARKLLHGLTLKWTNRIWFQRVIDKFLPTGMCLLCEERARPKNLIFCERDMCKATFCHRCFEDFGSQCYACMAEEGNVTTETTRTNSTATATKS